MRDRLIELILYTPSKQLIHCDRKRDKKYQYAEAVADYLLENGVIVPPCKVGQTIYYNCCGKIFKGKCHAITIHENSIQVHLYDFDGDNASYAAKDVYTSKEEAEQALKGGEG